jgi:hypothetical protein
MAPSSSRVKNELRYLDRKAQEHEIAREMELAV